MEPDAKPTFLVELKDHEGDAFEVETINGYVHLSDLLSSPGPPVANLMFTPNGAVELAAALNEAAGVAANQDTA